MHALLGALASVLLVVGVAGAADDKAAHHPTQTKRMTECNTHAADKHMTGDARKQFMSECLKGHVAADEETLKVEKESHSGKSKNGEHHNTQGEKMKACNQEASAKSLHGDDRRHFMSECLKGEKKS
jgi:hypothetical protein